MSLFDIDKKYLSHPDYPYKYHIKNVAGSFTDENHKTAAQFHDLGKLSDNFQNYINSINSNDNKKKTTHSLESALLFLMENKYQLDKIAFPIFLSIISHHGNLKDINSLANYLGYTKNILEDYPDFLKKISKIKEVAKLNGVFDIERCCDFFDDDPFVEQKDLYGIESYFRIKEVFSKLIFADKYEAIFKQSYNEKPFENVDFFIDKLLFLLSEKDNNLSIIRNEARISAVNKLKKNIDKKIFLIEAPTGIGKTFIALQLALEIVKNKNKKRIINSLPMTSIIDQIFEEYSKVINLDILMKYHHLTYSKEYLNDNNDEYEFYKQKNSFINNSWSEDKVIVTTFNQILNLFYSNKNSDLIKYWTLRDSVIIFDEIQAFPRVLLKDFSETINYLSNEMNIDFILMSATVPDIKKFIPELNICELLDNSFYSLDFNNRYILSIDNTIQTESDLVSRIIKEYKNKKSILNVLNTKKLALDIYNQLKDRIKEKNNIILLSSLFLPIHRKEIIDKVKKILKNNKKIIMISTQVIEAGVDLDFDIGFREFSPLYSILQTAGRINRENREEIKQYAKLIIFPKMGYSPYHSNDLLQEEVFELLSNDVRENSLLPILKKYFNIAINRTNPDGLLIKKIENLDFEEVLKIFNDNFMKALPYIIPVFIEYEENLYDSFITVLNDLYKKLKNKDISLEQKMELKINIKDIYKSISHYIVNVPINQTKNFELFNNDENLKLCRFTNLKTYYSIETGFTGDTSQPDYFF